MHGTHDVLNNVIKVGLERGICDSHEIGCVVFLPVTCCRFLNTASNT